MRRLLVVLAACSGPPSSTTDADVAPSHIVDPVVRGAHGSPIDIVAATSDGAAAVSQDAEGNTRLWPTLDGTAEPIVVHAAAAEELGLVRGPDGFLIASLDASGDLELVRIAPSGTTRSRRPIGDVTVHQIATTSHYLLALRDDQTIAAIDAIGHEHGRLAMPAGSRAVAIVTRNDHALAIVQHANATFFARPFDPETLTWGDAHPPFVTTSMRFAMSPDGTALAVANSTGVDILTLATGKSQRGCAEPSPTSTLFPLGFIDDHTIACMSFGGIHWFTIGKPDAIFSHDEPQPELVSYGGSVQITGDGLMIGIAAVEKKMVYLGYGLNDPSSLRTSVLGVTIAHDSKPVLLDRTLHTQREIAIDTTVFGDAMPLDDQRLLRTQPSAGALKVVLLDTKTSATAVIAETSDYRIHFEPATNLLAIHNNDHSSLIPYDPNTHRFGDALPMAGISHQIYLTDPALADGVVAVSSQILGGLASTVRITELKHTRRGIEMTRSYVVSGDVVATDRAARVYVASGDKLHVYVAGNFDAPIGVATFDVAGTPLVAPNNDATRVLVISSSHIMLADVDGHVRWTVPEQAVDVGWIANEPFAKFAAGLAKLDLRDGHLLERACGWQFGLHPSPTDSAGYTRSVCDAE
jgi:hypothetical protein